MFTNTALLIMGLGTSEMIFIGILLLVFFGANKIPELARGLGKGIREFKDATKDVKNEIDKSLEDKN
jgi:sec-independent protein translocase protein TatA